MAGVEAIARAFAAADPEPFQSLRTAWLEAAGRWDYRRPPLQSRALRTRGGASVSIDVTHHPDPWGERVLRQIRDSELVQGLDRVRPHFKPEPVTIYLLASLALDVTVDRVERWIDLKKGGSRTDQAIERASFLPLSDSEATSIFPDLWKARGTAGEDLPRWRLAVSALSAGKANNIDYSLFRHLSTSHLVEYRAEPKGPGGRVGREHQALVWGVETAEAARELVERLTGPLRTFAMVAGWIEATAAEEARQDEALRQAQAAASGEYAQQYAPAREQEPARAGKQGGQAVYLASRRITESRDRERGADQYAPAPARENATTDLGPVTMRGPSRRPTGTDPPGG